MSDEQDNINLDDAVDEGAQESVRKGKFLSPFIIRLLTIAAAVIFGIILMVIISMITVRCAASGSTQAGPVPYSDEGIKPARIEHLEYLQIEDPFRQRLIDGKMIQLKLSLGYKAGNKKIQQELTQIIPEIRDIIIKHLSHLKSEDFASDNALDELEEAFIKQVNRIINNGKVERIFFQEYTLM